MLNFLLVALGSALGGVARYAVSRLVAEHTTSLFPWPTFVVNVIGCFLIGVIYGIASHHGYISDNAKLFLTVGFCGGFTTFSTFAHENYLLFQSGNIFVVAAYAAFSFFAGIIMAYFGHAITGKF